MSPREAIYFPHLQEEMIRLALILMLQVQKWCGRCNIHGLWPQDACYCSAPPFHPITNETLRDLMLKTWSVPCEEEPPETLWQHEWIKHGSCSGLNQEEYFAFTTELFLHHTDLLCGSPSGHACFNLDGQPVACQGPEPESCTSRRS